MLYEALGGGDNVDDPSILNALLVATALGPACLLSGMLTFVRGSGRLPSAGLLQVSSTVGYHREHELNAFPAVCHNASKLGDAGDDQSQPISI